MTAHVLVIDDDPVQRRLLKNAVERYGHTPMLAENGKVGLELLKQHSGEVNVVVLDLMMPEMDGLGFLKAIGELGSDVPVIVQTGQGGIDTVVQAMRAGAFDFVVKPVSPERIGAAIANALKLDQREAKARSGRRSRSHAVNFSDIVSASPEMLRVIELAHRASQSSIPVVLEGESGVGKEMVARAIQSAGDRANKPFITVNCGAIPHNLVESILFGHEKGAFTGATEKHVGKFMEADGGTLYCTVLYFNGQAGLAGKHRKLMPTAGERLIWGFGDGSTLPVFDTPYGKIGAVICWENYMPMLRMYMYSQGVALYCAPTADDRDTWIPSMRHIALEGRCYVLTACQHLRRNAYPDDFDCALGDAPDTVLMRGGSAIIDPLGEVLAGPDFSDETILYADIQPNQILRGKYDFDVSGHYARPDVFQLQVDTREKRPVSAVGAAAPQQEA